VVFDVTSGASELLTERAWCLGDAPVDVVFRAQTASGTIERIYRFRGDRYDFETSVRANEAVLPGVNEVSWSFGPGIGPTEANVQDDQTAFKASTLLGEELHREGPGAFGRQHVKNYSGTLNGQDVLLSRRHLSGRADARRHRHDWRQVDRPHHRDGDGAVNRWQPGHAGDARVRTV
jgi:hypothetical protein